jgi:hypothetical protein
MDFKEERVEAGHHLGGYDLVGGDGIEPGWQEGVTQLEYIDWRPTGLAGAMQCMCEVQTFLL